MSTTVKTGWLKDKEGELDYLIKNTYMPLTKSILENGVCRMLTFTPPHLRCVISLT